MESNDGKNPNKRAWPAMKPAYIRRIGVLTLNALVIVLLGASVWLSLKAGTAKSEMESAVTVGQKLQGAVVRGDRAETMILAEELQSHTHQARIAVEDPFWAAAELIPWLGHNLSASAEIVRTADDVALSTVLPLARTSSDVEWEELFTGGKVDTASIERSAPAIGAAAKALRISLERLDSVDDRNLVSQISVPLNEIRGRLGSAGSALDVAADVAQLAPKMAGSDSVRNYLLLIQNNAETRASGGIASALAVVTFESGSMSLGTQNTANGLGRMDSSIVVEEEQERIYSRRLGKFMQDVNLTPDFPTAAKTAQAIWESKTGQRVDGVIAVDPVALSYVMGATGPVTNPELQALARGGLPAELTSANVVKTLLADVYNYLERPAQQDVYFAEVARQVFSELSAGKADATDLIEGLTQGVREGRIKVWSAYESEQSVLYENQIGGAIDGPSVSPSEFGVYFNDGTGAKMDYYVRRTAQLVRDCTADGYQQVRVRVTSTNTAPQDAATSFPQYVTGGGSFGVPAGSVQTNIVAYGPVQAQVETVTVDGRKTEFAPHIHSNRPVGVYAVRLAPGESKTLEFTFRKIVQSTEPKLVVTPTVQSVKDVILTTENSTCPATS